jgi:hypothetical protein
MQDVQYHSLLSSQPVADIRYPVIAFSFRAGLFQPIRVRGQAELQCPDEANEFPWLYGHNPVRGRRTRLARAIVVNYHSKRSRAEDVAAAVRALGQRALVAQADLTGKDEVAAMMDSVRLEFGCIDTLILSRATIFVGNTN